MNERLSYHDVVVTVDGVDYWPSKNYNLELILARTTGWKLWLRTGPGPNDMREIGGEYSGHDFRIKVGDHVILNVDRKHKE